MSKSKYKLADIMDPSFDLPKDISDLQAVYKRLAKTADQRLLRLEQLTESGNYVEAKRYAYNRAMTDIAKWSKGEDATRFNRNMPQNATALRAKIADIKTFLKSETSRKGGLTDVYEKRTAAFNKEYGTDLKWHQLKDLMDSDLASKIDDKLGYRTKNKILARITKRKNDIKKAIETNSVTKLRMAPDEVGREMRKILLENGEDVLKFIEGIGKGK